MKGLFKKLGQGFIFIFVFPFWVIVFVLFTVYAILSFIFTFILAIPAYFKGESILAPSELDIIATTKIAEQKHLSQLPEAPLVVQPSQPTINVYVGQTPPQIQPPPQTYIEQDGVIYRAITEQEAKLLAEQNVIKEENHD